MSNDPLPSHGALTTLMARTFWAARSESGGEGGVVTVGLAKLPKYGVKCKQNKGNRIPGPAQLLRVDNDILASAGTHPSMPLSSLG